MAKIIPVIMSGGAGTRLWPASRQAKPKQLLKLAGEQTLMQQTASRFSGDNFLKPIIVCNQLHQERIAKQMDEIGIQADYICEPVARNTAACAAIAAMAVAEKDKDALMILAPADHFIKNQQEFRQVIEDAVPAASAGYITTFGITATSPETGYGYIKKGSSLDEKAFLVEEFCEKPDIDTARNYISSGKYFWNAGIFIASPQVLLSEMKKYRPDIIQACEKCWQKSKEQDSVIALDKSSFAACPSVSIDYAVMENTKKAAVVEANIGWSDIGSWSALRDLDQDKNGNCIKGDAHVIETNNTLIHSDGPFVAAIGVENLAIVVHEGAILIADMDKAQNVKQIVEMLKSNKKESLI